MAFLSSIAQLLGLGPQQDQSQMGTQGTSYDPMSSYLMQMGYGTGGTQFAPGTQSSPQFNPAVAQAGQAPAAQPPMNPGTPSDVVVTGKNTQVPDDAGIDLSGITTGAFNRAPLEVSPADVQSALQQHKGMFGIHGGLRDIIGGLGDAFLMGAGRAPAYWNQRQAERQGDLQRGFTGSDQGATDAIERLTAGGFPTQAAAAENQLENRKVNRLRAQNYAAAQQQAVQAKARGNLATYVRGIKDQDTYEANKPQLQRMADLATGGAPGSYKLPDKVEDAQDLLGNFDITGNAVLRNQVATTRADEQARHNRVTEATGQQNAAAHTMAASRSRAAPQPTVAGVVAPILAKQARGEQLSGDEQAVLQATGNTAEAHQRGRGGAAAAFRAMTGQGGGTQPAPTPGRSGKMVFRNGRLVPATQ